LIGKDPGLVDFANIKPTLVPNKTIFEHAQTAKTPEEFAGKILADMGYPAEV